jgi:hypothetical protein
MLSCESPYTKSSENRSENEEGLTPASGTQTPPVHPPEPYRHYYFSRILLDTHADCSKISSTLHLSRMKWGQKRCLNDARAR